MSPKSKKPENPVVSMLREEKTRSERMIAVFQSEVKELPAGTLQKKQRRDKEYFYHVSKNAEGKVTYRRIQGGDIPSLDKKIKRRVHLESNIKTLQEGIKILKRALREKDD